jgi:hypothetical protein
MSETFIKVGDSYINTKDIKQVDTYKNRYDTKHYRISLRDNTIIDVPAHDIARLERWLGSCSY